MFTPAIAIAAFLTLAPFVAAAFFAHKLAGAAYLLPLPARLMAPALLCIPYLVVSWSCASFRWGWLAVYALLPIAIAVLMHQARRIDPAQHGDWRDYLVLAALGLSVDLRWFEPAWPAHLAIFNKILLLDAGVYGLLMIRQLNGAGFDLRLHLHDAVIGLREFILYAPLALILGLGIGFLHLHAAWPYLAQLTGALLFTFFFIAVPEELFFRGWLQNLLERRIGRTAALLLTAILFGLAHFNKRSAVFNWRYVLLAAVAGVFYGRAWRHERRVGAAAITHACVDTVWSFWLR
jgi:hypothetical protein